MRLVVLIEHLCVLRIAWPDVILTMSASLVFEVTFRYAYVEHNMQRPAGHTETAACQSRQLISQAMWYHSP